MRTHKNMRRHLMRNIRKYIRRNRMFIVKQLIRLCVYILVVSMVYTSISKKNTPEEETVSSPITISMETEEPISLSFLVMLDDNDLLKQFYYDDSVKYTSDKNPLDVVEEIIYDKPSKEQILVDHTEIVKNDKTNEPKVEKTQPLETKNDSIDEKSIIEEDEKPNEEVIPIEKEELDDNDNSNEVIEEEIAEEEVIEEPVQSYEEDIEEELIEPIPENISDTTGFDVAVVGDIRKSYMDYKKIRSRTSPQYKLQQKALTDGNGLRVVDGRYCVAMTTIYGSVGQCVDVYLADGTVIPCVIGDHKSPQHSSNNNTLGADGSAIEFIVETGSLPSTVRQSGDVSSQAGFQEEVVGVKIYPTML